VRREHKSAHLRIIIQDVGKSLQMVFDRYRWCYKPLQLALPIDCSFKILNIAVVLHHYLGND
jgi:hypothetical protein